MISFFNRGKESKRRKLPLHRTPHVSRFTLHAIALAVGLPVASPALTVHPRGSEPVAMVTTNRPILTVSRRTYTFPKAGVFVSNEFEGARFNDFQQTGPATYTATVAPENFPINDSCWYAFKIWSASNQVVHVKLEYQHGKHRYPPQTSTDGAHWEKLPRANSATNDSGRSVTLTLNVGPQPLWVAGQELFTSKDFKEWSAELAKLPFVQSRVLGQSTLGKPIYELELTEAGPDAKCVLVLSRQHPPEVTGTFALRAFVQTLCADTPLAKSFRKQFKVVIVPEANPDGVDAGHWRHNARGVDLNRDWGQFHQTETRLLRDEFLRFQKTACFGLDFHSTFHDVFYPSQKNGEAKADAADKSNPTQIDDLVWKWLNQVQTRVPEYEVNIEASSHHSGGSTMTSTAWMRRALKIPAVTYEAGDATDRNLIRKVAEAGAEAMMELLLAK